ncbi:Afadin and alpha-actinin-binding-domain-containing protein [Coniella lustricola]|uniref:Afadin and alpha-actinin-binding-domain-containing protein n=1 Tax=Coniella lustricola TaxID=2025994 RepID=A0A2T3AAY5_9PEZI|nr:Afadin and alpha-actinin-binding-domain-containing protein [Coniella lustricola]
MMDFDNLRTASVYINNQLLSRGLLRDGRAIRFDSPGDNDYDLADTMGRIMSVVNDLILRRDRDAEHRESLSTALRTLRADSLRQTDNITRLHERFTEAQRKANIADAEEASLRAQLKASEGTIHKLKDEASRTKKLVAETRSACANEVRKRDRQIEGLKKAAADAGKTRGERKSSGITTIQVSGDFGGNAAATAVSTSDEDYTLRHETNEFLAQLASGLSEENETLLALLRRTNASLKSVSGWDKSTGDAVAKGDGMAVTLTADAEDLATDLDGLLAHLHTTLTNPAYVLAEDVNKELSVLRREIEVRDEALNKMVVRWRDAVHLLDSWRRRMAANGRSVDMEELKMGLRLSPIRVQRVRETAHNEPLKLATLLEEEAEHQDHQEQGGTEKEREIEMEDAVAGNVKSVLPSPAESLHLVPAGEPEEVAAAQQGDHADYDFDSDSESSIFQDDVDIDIGGFKRPEPKNKMPSPSSATAEDEAESVASVALPQPPTITPLEETQIAGNRKPTHTSVAKSRKRSGDPLDDNEAEDEDGEASAVPSYGTRADAPPHKRLKVSDDLNGEKFGAREENPFKSSLDEALLSKAPSQPASSRQHNRTTAEARQPRAPTKVGAGATPATRSSRRVAEAKRTTPVKSATTQRTTARATAPTASSVARTATPSSRPESRARAAAPSPTSRTAMPPPARPRRTTKLTPTAKSATSAVPIAKQWPNKDQRRPSLAARQDEQQSSPKPTKQNTNAGDSQPGSAPRPTKPAASSSASPIAQSPAKNDKTQSHPLSRPARLTMDQSPVTVASIAAKLAASEREANAARVRAKLRAARLSKSSSKAVTGSGAASSGAGDIGDAEKGDPTKRDRPSAVATSSAAIVIEENDAQTAQRETSQSALINLSSAVRTTGNDTSIREGSQRAITIHSSSPHKTAREQQGPASPVATQHDHQQRQQQEHENIAITTATTITKPRKREVRSRAEKVASRRRSTLSPWELQSLIAGDVVPLAMMETAIGPAALAAAAEADAQDVDG